ncbi:MAG: galactose oxidase-like domain-containing protein [bacterium]
MIDTPNDDQGSYRPLYGIHTALLRDGVSGHSKLLLFRDELLLFDLDVPPPGDNTWTMNLRGSVYPTPVRHQPMCGSYLPVPLGGKLLVLGGRLYDYYHWNDRITIGWVSLFDPSGSMAMPRPPTGSAWQDLNDLIDLSGTTSGCDPNTHATGRYYATLTPLDNGKILLVSGSFWTDCDHSGYLDGAGIAASENTTQPTWGIFDPTNNQWTFDSQAQPGGFARPWQGVDPIPLYPHMKVLPCGLFFAGVDNAYGGPPVPSYVWASLGDGAGWNSSQLSQYFKRRNRAFGNCVVLTLDARQDKLRVLMVGGGDFYLAHDGDPNSGTKGAEIITYRPDGTATLGGWVPAGTMNSGPRWNGNSVLLPTGDVLTIGGDMDDPDPPVHEGPIDPPENHTCEIYASATGVWSPVADLPLSPNPPLPPADPYVHRGHHSTAILLLDGRICSAAHEIETRTDRYQKNYMVYYPPYLFDPNDQFASRPVIQTAPSVANYGLPFEITLEGNAVDVAEVALMHPGAPTHGVDFSQRRVLLSHSLVPGETHQLIVAGPRDSTYAPPGDYMLFVLTAAGTPSKAKWINVQRGGSYAVESGHTVRWGGDVWLDRDFWVKPGGTLIIEAGTHVTALAHVDRGNVQDATAGLVELVIDGQVVMNGTGTLDSQHVTLTSTAKAQGDWGGILFRDKEANPVSRISMLAYPEIDYAKRGVKVDTLACDLIHPKFNISGSGNYQIYLDASTRIAEGHEWNLDAPTTVSILAYGPLNDYQRFQILVDGALRTQRPAQAAPTDRVVFGPTVPDDFSGADWQGITVRGDGFADGIGVARVKDAELSHASFPLTFVLADTAEVRDSWIHHYHDEGITDYLADATIVGNTIWRGDGLNPQFGDGVTPVGRVGIHLVSSLAVVSGNQVFHQMQKGIWADFASSGCTGSLPQPPDRTLGLRQNVVIGDKDDFGTLDASGIEVSWACRRQDVESDSCNVQNWPANGIKIRQASDVGIGCNCIGGNVTGVFHRRDKLAIDATKSDGYSILGRNLFDKNTDQNVTTYYVGPAGETGTATAGIYGGGYTHPLRGSSGANLLKMFNGSTQNWRLDASQARTDVAQANGWMDEGGNALTTEQHIQDHNYYSSALGQSIDVTNFVASATEPSCRSQSWTSFCQAPAGPPTGTTVAMRPTGNAPDGHGATSGVPPFKQATGIAGSDVDLPRVLALLPPRPNPAREGVVMRLDVPVENAGWAEVKVYDVTGRRVRSLFSGGVAPGRHDVAWDLRDESDRRVASGVYFARMELAEKSEMRRIVVVK